LEEFAKPYLTLSQLEEQEQSLANRGDNVLEGGNIIVYTTAD
jgi:hypothetical protein